jgi:hypothetical protein
LEVGPKMKIFPFEFTYHHANNGNFLDLRKMKVSIFEVGSFEVNWKV